MAGKVIFVQ